MEEKAFSLAQVLSVVTGRLFCQSFELLEIFEFMTGDQEIVSFQIVDDVKESCRLSILAQYPQFQDDLSELTPENWKVWLGGQIEKHGKRIPIRKLEEGIYRPSISSEISEKKFMRIEIEVERPPNLLLN